MSRTQLLVGASALALPLLSADPPAKGHDLTPRFEEGQELTITNEVLVGFGLDDATYQVGEIEMLPEVPIVDVEIEVLSELSETILKAEDGAIKKMRRTHVEEGVHFAGEAGIQNNFQDFDESQDGPTLGRTIELTATEDGWQVEDLTEDEEPLEGGLLAVMTEKSHFEQLLPKREVEVGSTWDVGEAMIQEMKRTMSAAAAQGEGFEKFAGLVEALQDSIELDATGKLVSVEGDNAKIEWTMSAELVIDDLFGMLREVMDPEMTADMPEDAEGSLEFAVEMTGGGIFDLAARQLTESSFDGEFALATEFEMVAPQGQEMNASADASGVIELESSIAVE